MKPQKNAAVNATGAISQKIRNKNPTAKISIPETIAIAIVASLIIKPITLATIFKDQTSKYLLKSKPLP